MMSADESGNEEQSANIAELSRQVCEIGKALANPDIYNLLLSVSEEMERRAYGKPIRWGWTAALSEARKGNTNLRLICAELVDKLQKHE